LPEDIPQRERLVQAEIETLGDLEAALENDEVGLISQIGPARVDQIEEFFESFIE
jgi:hypothetical protein